MWSDKIESVVYCYCYYTENNRPEMLFLSEAIFVVGLSSSCSHNGCKCSQMINTTVVQKKGGRKSRRVADLCLSECIWLIDIVNGFSVFKNHCKSRLEPDGPPCNRYSNSICPIIKRHVLCLLTGLKNDTQH